MTAPAQPVPTAADLCHAIDVSVWATQNVKDAEMNLTLARLAAERARQRVDEIRAERAAARV